MGAVEHVGIGFEAGLDLQRFEPRLAILGGSWMGRLRRLAKELNQTAVFVLGAYPEQGGAWRAQ